MQHALAQLARHGAIGQRDRTAVGELEGADIERIGAAVFGEFCAGDAVAAAAFVRVEIVEIGRWCCRGLPRAARYRCGSSRPARTPWGSAGSPQASPKPAACPAARSPPAAPGPRRRSRRHHGYRECWARWRSRPSALAGRPRLGEGCGAGGLLLNLILALPWASACPSQPACLVPAGRIGRARPGSGTAARRNVPPRPLLGGASLNRSAHGAAAPGFRREGGRCWHAKQEPSRDNGNHCRCNAAKGAISPFSACFLRGKVHFNSMNLTPIRR